MPKIDTEVIEMAPKKGGKCNRSYYQAKLATNVGECVFCRRTIDDEVMYGKLYAIGDIQCHYFCALLSCCLIQKGSDDEGLLGFLYPDILAEVERSKKHRCSYCNREGANLGCSVTQCRKQFHLPCGRERNAVSLFYGNYKSFCVNHAPKQKIVDSIMPNVKKRLAEHRRRKESQKLRTKELENDPHKAVETFCVICYEQVEGYPTPRTFWPPCCARDAWFHRACLQRMALSAGMHYLKCPLCNDKEAFYKAVVSQGYYVPDRDAAWELEQNAFADIYERPIFCSAEECKCPAGREYDSDAGLWDIKLCILCGSTCIHTGCADSTEEDMNVYVCKTCKPAAPGDLEKLIASVEKVQLHEQTTETVQCGPIMPSRMSLRRTKPRRLLNGGPSCSQKVPQSQYVSPDKINIKTESNRLELNLKKPMRRIFGPSSPIKMLELGFSEKLGQLHSGVLVDSSTFRDKLKEKLKKPCPLVVKKKIINNILDELFNNVLHDPKSKEPVKEWISPKKSYNIQVEKCEEFNTDVAPIDINISQEKPLCVTENIIKSKPVKTIALQYINTEKETASKNELFKCNLKQKCTEFNSEVVKMHTAINSGTEEYKENYKRKLFTEDGVLRKKQKVNSSLKREAVCFSVSKREGQDSKENDIVEGITYTDINKINHEGNLKIFKPLMIEGADGYINKKNCIEQFKDTITSDKESKISCSPQKRLVEDLFEKALDLDLGNKLKSDRTKENAEHKSIQESIIWKGWNAPVKNYFEELVGLERHISDLAELKGDTQMKLVNDFKEAAINTEMDAQKKDDDPTVEKNRSQRKKKTCKKNKHRHNLNHTKNKNTSKKKRNSGKHSKVLKSENKHLNLTINDKKGKLKLKYKKKHNKKLSIQNKNIKVKIKWKKEKLMLKVTGHKEKKKRLKDIKRKVFKQYVLKYSPELTSPKQMIMKPDNDVTPVRRRRAKVEKHADNMVQTNISSFFKVTPKRAEN